MSILVRSAIAGAATVVLLAAPISAQAATSGDSQHPGMHGAERPLPPGPAPARVAPAPPSAPLPPGTAPAQRAPLPQGAPPRAGGAGFFVDCSFSHTANVDPIVMPGMVGMGHQHEFFGSTGTDENSTGESLLAGGTTCTDAADKSAYWVPSLLQNGTRVAPVKAHVDYRGGLGTVAFPAGFKAIAGKTSQSAAWACSSPGVKPVFGTDIATVPECASGQRLHAQITFPECWDGTSLDSSDHMSHLAYATRESATSRPVCPADHPVRVPQVKLDVTYGPGATGGAGVRLSSGAASTLHADIFEAWDAGRLAERLAVRGPQPPAVRN